MQRDVELGKVSKAILTSGAREAVEERRRPDEVWIEVKRTILGRENATVMGVLLVG
jgi:hypothetical protein